MFADVIACYRNSSLNGTLPGDGSISSGEDEMDVAGPSTRYLRTRKKDSTKPNGQLKIFLTCLS